MESAFLSMCWSTKDPNSNAKTCWTLCNFIFQATSQYKGYSCHTWDPYSACVLKFALLHTMSRILLSVSPYFNTMSLTKQYVVGSMSLHEFGAFVQEYRLKDASTVAFLSYSQQQYCVSKQCSKLLRFTTLYDSTLAFFMPMMLYIPHSFKG